MSSNAAYACLSEKTRRHASFSDRHAYVCRVDCRVLMVVGTHGRMIWSVVRRQVQRYAVKGKMVCVARSIGEIKIPLQIQSGYRSKLHLQIVIRRFTTTGTHYM